jgi:hypothetical protein
VALQISKITDNGWEKIPNKYTRCCHTSLKLECGVLCAVSTTRIIRPILFFDTINSEQYIGQILTQFFLNLSDVEKEYEFFQQHSATANTANNSMAALCNIFGGHIIFILCGLLHHLV